MVLLSDYEPLHLVSNMFDVKSLSCAHDPSLLRLMLGLDKVDPASRFAASAQVKQKTIVIN